jgi:nucleoside-diphosphate-sugar epimerase
VTHPVLERILVTGGNGFIGRHVVRRLRENGYDPLITVSPSHHPLPDTSFLDVTDPAAVQALFDSYKPATVLHLAGTTGHNDPAGSNCRRMNLDATVNIVDAAAGKNVSRLILIGSAAEYGSQPTPFREDMPARPVSAYGRSKAEACEYAMRAFSAAGLPVTVLRVFTAYGPGQSDKMFLSQLIAAALKGESFVMSDGQQRRDMVHIGDVVRAILRSMTIDNAAGRIINIGSGRGTRLKDIARAVWKECRADPERLVIGGRDKTGDDLYDTEADITLAAHLLDWSPTSHILNDDSRPARAFVEVIGEMRCELTTPVC